MRKKLSLLVITLAVGLILSACGPIGSQPRSLSVTGSGMVSLTPDIAFINIGVHTDNPDLAAAVNQNNTKTQALVDALKNAGIAETDIQTSNFSVYTNGNRNFDPSTGQEIAGGTYYSVDNTVYVTLRDLTKLGNLLNTAVATGANNINGITFDVADKSAAMTEARQKAMADAAKVASELAQSAGFTLGTIQTIQYSENSPLPYYGMGGGGAAPANASVPIQPGQTQISVVVNVTYSVK
jgi:uncharacterized protein